jgi:hypothetical protein
MSCSCSRYDMGKGSGCAAPYSCGPAPLYSVAASDIYGGLNSGSGYLRQKGKYLNAD